MDKKRYNVNQLFFVVVKKDSNFVDSSGMLVTDVDFLVRSWGSEASVGRSHPGPMQLPVGATERIETKKIQKRNMRNICKM